jgi:Resolvase, N terminal domain
MCKNPNFCVVCRNVHFTGDFGLQKSRAKVHSFAGIFATVRSDVMNIGYARVSTLDQNFDLQIQALRKAGCKTIFREKVSGVSRGAAGVSAHARSAPQWRYSHCVETRSPSPLDPRPAGHDETIREAGAAEFERDLIRERTSAGREAARRRGIHFGRPRKLNPEQTKLARRLIDEGQSVREDCEYL